jgi:hypothetical protein
MHSLQSILVALCAICCLPAIAQTDIFGEVQLDNFNYSKPKSYCMRLYGYHRCTHDGWMQMKDRELKLYRIYEGVSTMDVRYKKDYDDGAKLIVGRNLVHPDRDPQEMSFYELKPYTFLEQARKDGKNFILDVRGDTTLIYTKKALVGTVVRDTTNHEVRMTYNALAPDTAMSINLLIVKARLSNLMADAVYAAEDSNVDYVPQGALKRIVFEGDITLNISGTGNENMETFHELTEFYVDSVAYMTKDEYKAEQRLSKKQRQEHSHYSAADIDRLRKKHGVPDLTRQQRERIEQQLDWEEELAHMMETEKIAKKVLNKAVKKN